MDFLDFTDHSRLDPFVGQPRPFCRVALVSHLRCDPCGSGGLGQRPAFVEGMGKGFLAVHMFVSANRRHRSDRMGVVRRADRDGINVLGVFVDHLTKIFVPLCLGNAV